MKRLVVGVIGHVDHGKTALVRALTGRDTDRLPAEKQRGISIALGFAHFKVGSDTDIDLIDMPGHERFVRTMISGATGMEAVLLVVAANEGIKPQTVEHMDIARLLGVRRAVVAIAKTDLVSPEEAERVAQNVTQYLEKARFEAPPPVLTSAQTGEGLEALRRTLTNLATDQSNRAEDGLAFLPIDRAFAVAGHGPVVTGTLRGAPIKAGDRLELLPAKHTLRVRTIQVHGNDVTAATPGQRVALNLRNVEIAGLKRGMVLAAPDTLTPSDWLTISVRTVDSAPPLKNGIRLRLLAGTGECDARLRLLDRDRLEPGQTGFAQLHCAGPVASPAREHVILRLASPPRTVAGGKILEPATRRQRRNSPAILKRLTQLRDLPYTDMMAAELERAGLAGSTLGHLTQITALARPCLLQRLQTLPVVVDRSGLVLRKTDLDALCSRIPSRLEEHATGLPPDKLLAALPDTSAAALDEALARLVAGGAVAHRAGQYFSPRPEQDRARARNAAALALRIEERVREAGLSPPTPKEIMTDSQSKSTVDRLLRDGILIRAVDRAKGKEILFHRDAIERAKQDLAPLLANAPGLLVTEIGATLGISRKYSMPLIDHLDTIRFTRRVQDRRVLYAMPSPVA